MKIGIVLSNPPAYSETFFNSKIKGLLKNGFEVELFVSASNGEFNLCKVTKAPSIHGGNLIRLVLSILIIFLKLLCYLPRVIKFYNLQRKGGISFQTVIKNIYLNSHLLTSKNIDWLHFGFATQAIGRELVAKSIDAKMAVSFRGFDLNVYPVKNPNCYQLLWKHVDKVHSISNYLLKESYSLGLSKNIPFKIITPAVSINTLDLVSDKKQQNVRVQIATIARLHWMKGIDLLIATASLLKDKKLDFTWSVIGGGDQKTTERYQYHIFEKELQDNVQLLGKLTHQEALLQLQNVNLYVQTSLNEGFCNAVLEAQALGKLCVATNVGGIPENIVDEETGWLVAALDAEALATKIIEIVSLSSTQKKQVSIAASKRVTKDFSIEKQEREFVAFYNEL